MYYPVSGGVIQIDEEDLSIISAFNWYICSIGYAKSTVNDIYMHRLISNPKNNEFVHHINENRLYNKKFNLQNIDKYEHERVHYPVTGSVWRDKRVNPENKPWLISVRYNKKQKVFGNFEDPFTARFILDIIQGEII